MTPVRLRAALVPVVMTLMLVVFTVVGTSVWELAVLPLTTRPLSAVDLSATPAGWIPVAFGKAQVSVPPTWVVMTHAWCGGTWPRIVQLGVVKRDMDCPATPTPPKVRITPLGTIPAPYAQEQPVRLNGISVLPGPTDALSISYFVPSLHVEVRATDGSGVRVIDTLAVSPLAFVLASGPSPSVPSSWHSVAFAGLRFSVPANWPVNRTSVTPGLGAICRQQGVAFSDTTVTLSTDARALLLPPCPLIPPTPQQPENGVQIDSGLRTEPTVTLSFSARCLDMHGRTACPASSPAYSILVLKLNVPGRDKPVFFSIGLAGNGMVARTILYSLRAT